MGKEAGNGLSVDFGEPTTDFINHDPGRAIRFFNLPMPPSSNNQYILVRRSFKTLHVPSKGLSEYQRAMRQWPFRYPNSCMMARALMAQWVEQKTPLEFHAVFFFQRSQLFTKDGRMKKLDVSNRIKALHDSVGEILSVDDSTIFRLSAEKAISEQNIQMVCIEIQPFQ